MFGLCALLLFTSVAQALPFGGNVQCTLNYNIVHEEKCHHKQVCHEEHEVVVTTTLIEECEDIVTKHCHNEHKNVYHTTNVVGHDTSVVGHEVGHSYGHSYMESVKLMLVTQVVHNARSMLRRSAIRSLSK